MYKIQAQGDLLIIQRTNTGDKATGRAKRQILHKGEGRDHGHVLVGKCTVTKATTSSKALKAWNIEVPKGEKVELRHENIKSKKLVGEHGTKTLTEGTWRIGTQRSFDPDKTEMRVMD